ncbi:phosphotransferase family protein [Paenibacillus sp. SAF-054]|uniref:phosphotransferase family protein n=1 Tax=unclassified Paenibacillus TaxID=185978 RepID=UPI003F811AB2
MGKNEEVIGAGRTAELLAFGPRRVLKLFREGIPFGIVEDEYRNSQETHRSGLSVPQPYEMLERNGRAGIVYEQVDGMTMLAAISRNPWIVDAEARRMARLHVAMHEHRLDGLQRQKSVLAGKIAETSQLTEKEKRQISMQLDQLEEGHSICHGDYHPDNIMIGTKEWIIDWMTATAGSPAADVARTLLLLRSGTLPEELPPDIQELFNRTREQLTTGYLQEYMKLSGMTISEIERWMVPVAAARLVEWIPAAEKEKLLELIRHQLG